MSDDAFLLAMILGALIIVGCALVMAFVPGIAG